MGRLYERGPRIWLSDDLGAVYLSNKTGILSGQTDVSGTVTTIPIPESGYQVTFSLSATLQRIPPSSLCALSPKKK